MRIRPCIDIHNGKVKQIVGSSLKDSCAEMPRENFVSDKGASYYAGLYKEADLPGGHVILLNSPGDTKNYSEDEAEAKEALRFFPGGLSVGGGITPRTAPAWIEAGASHIIVTSYVFSGGVFDVGRCRELLDAVGKEHLILDLSCRRTVSDSQPEYRVVTDRWQKATNLPICGNTLDELSAYCDEFLIHAADAEGKRGGIEKELVAILGEWQKKSGFPVTYAGGVRSLDDLDIISEYSGNLTDVTVGSALDLFGGNLSLKELSDRCGLLNKKRLPR